MNTYAIRRKQAWQSPQAVEQVAGRSKQVADDDFRSDIRWIRSYVIAEDDGTLGSICIYQATSPEAIRKHAHRVGMPADEIFPSARQSSSEPTRPGSRPRPDGCGGRAATRAPALREALTREEEQRHEQDPGSDGGPSVVAVGAGWTESGHGVRAEGDRRSRDVRLPDRVTRLDLGCAEPPRRGPTGRRR
jgi:hypothetical protein